ncbi:fibrous sheath CABYR-binding protein-like isoform X2 [Amphibalanus amphitrite]|uniref:fibrous sheath CABYR-binding protein-like isoform X2 n=1 Tax=Amphibalanus amphitrite TaxID=1232801 RepID=UPI001C902C5F|nr:fibrous sheath CABYR-binding protein-like isoform X2 [Amphibalanus amphitrite]
MADAEEPAAAAAPASAPAVGEPSETVAVDEVEPAPAQDAVVEVVAQEMAEVVVEENATPIETEPEQQGETTDILEPVEELPLDDEMVEMLPTVIEDPENEAKEQKELLEELVEETEESGDQPQTDVDDKHESTQGEVPETDPADIAAQSTSEVTGVGREEEGKTDQHDASSVVMTDTTPIPAETHDVEVEESADVEKVTVSETSEAPAEATEVTKADEDKPDTIQMTEDEVASAEQAAEDARQSRMEPLEETEPQAVEVSEPTDVAHDPATENEAQEGELKPVEKADETTDEKKEKKKRKRSKEERKKKKSVEEKDVVPEQKSSKPALLHVRGGFSCGWVGPMLQLLGTMKKLDEFKECHGKRYTPKGSEHGQRPEALDVAPEPEQEAEPAEVPNIPEAAIRAPPGEGCPRCGGAVFEAERMKSRFRSYHKPCFNCKACHRILDSTLACDGPDKDVYCKLCYAKKYGPKGYGFGGGKAFLQSDIIAAESPQSKPEWVKLDRTTIRPTEGSGCPRCGGAVFAAELMMSKGQEWHTSCFSCRDCKRPLDSTIACDGPDSEIYCKLDYAKRFGPKGFGFGHTLVSFMHGDEQENAEENVQPAGHTNMGPKAAPGEGCPRCEFAVYAAERMLHNGKAYHRHCFSCVQCSRGLDSTNTCSGPDHELLCRTCYGKMYGPHGVGFGQGAGVLSMG